MPELSQEIKVADWKSEKHVPVIECDERVAADQLFQIKVSLGKEIAHPNTTEHHIRWISLYFKPEGGKNIYQIAHTEFTAHGEATDGANEGPVYTHHATTTEIKVKTPGTISALAYCNIHGLWQSSKEIGIS